MISKKKVIYFLLACDEKKTAEFLYKYNYSFKENKSFPHGFIKYSKYSFKKNKNRSHLIENNPFLFWQCFCKNNHYEEVLPVVLCKILKYPEEKVSWLLKVQPKILSYRLNQGLLLLGEEFFKIPLENINSKEMISTLNQKDKLNGNLKKNEPEEKKKKAIIYSNWLAEQTLPIFVEQITPNKKNKKIKNILLVFLCLVFSAVAIWLVFLSPSSTVILYKSGLNKSF